MRRSRAGGAMGANSGGFGYPFGLDRVIQGNRADNKARRAANAMATHTPCPPPELNPPPVGDPPADKATTPRVRGEYDENEARVLGGRP